MTWKFACNQADIPENGIKEVAIDDVRVLLLRADGELYATPPLCPHMEEPLANGICDAGTLICIKHLWRWNLRTGEPEGDAEIPLLKYQVRQEADGSVQVFIEGELRYDY